MMLIRLTDDTDGTPVYVNPEHIQWVRRVTGVGKDYTVIRMVDNQSVGVVDSVQDIIERLQSVGGGEQ